ncbi:MAG: SDR family NAD(P)-dependent oxidoreductase [Deltaproteobacteria bacterium]|nr:SDR family NAD(P)-dependent oxidoreductase [Deltaproteobacteria bacterium]
MAADRPWALVTGASSGLGSDFARQLAARGWNVILTARRRDRMEALAVGLRDTHKAEVEILDGDLGLPEFRDQLVAQATAGRHVQMIINNAGFGQQGKFLDGDYGRWADMLALNIAALTDLSYRLGRHMREHGKPSHVVNIASIGAFQPVPAFAVYAATKSYVRDFSEAFAFEVTGSNVAVTCVCPGGTRTEFMEAAGMTLTKAADAALQSSESVVREALDTALGGGRLVVTGWLNKLATFLTRLSPRWLSAKVAEFTMRPPS